jgi:hypothetical protein
MSALQDPFSTLESKLTELEAYGISDSTTSAELLAQRDYYNAQRAAIESAHAGKVVAACNNQLFVGDDLISVELAATAAFPNNQFYIEFVPPRPVGLSLQDHQV